MTTLTKNDIIFIINTRLKYNEAYEVLSDIASDESFEYLEDVNYFVNTKLNALLKFFLLTEDIKYVDLIMPTIYKIEDELEAFEQTEFIKNVENYSRNDLIKKIIS